MVDKNQKTKLNHSSKTLSFLIRILSKITSPITRKVQATLKQHYIEAINEDPKDSDALNNLGVLNYEFGNYKQSLKDLTKAITLNSQYHHLIHFFCSAIYSYIGHIYFLQEKYVEAISQYEQAFFQDHENAEAILALKKLARKLSNYQLSPAVKKKDSSPDFKLNFSNFSNSKYYKNIPLDFDFGQISNLRYKNLFSVLSRDDQEIENIFYKLDYLYQKKYFTEVIKLSNEALENHNEASIYYYIACSFYHLNQYKLAEEYFAKYILKNKGDNQSLYDYSICLIANHDYRKAARNLKKIQQDNENYEFVIFALGLCEFFQKKYNAALDHFLQARSIAIKKHDLYHANASTQFYNRAYVFFLQRKYELAVSDLTKSLDLQKDNQDALLLRAKIYIQKKNKSDAIIDLDKILEINPENEEASYLLEQVLH